MKRNLEALVPLLSKKLTDEGISFLSNLNDGDGIETASDVMDLMLSSYINALFTLIRLIAFDNVKGLEKVEIFINEIQNCIINSKVINSVTYTKEGTI
jgi:hypothetical protein